MKKPSDEVKPSIFDTEVSPKKLIFQIAKERQIMYNTLKEIYGEEKANVVIEEWDWWRRLR